ncbi:hypothetical protein APT69_05400 [Klebsiella pneumoniae]|nr:hypothetical protein APT69_05400 [Klebsiella pneumoniae]
MANWLHQLQSLLGQQGASPSGESSKGSGLLPGAIGGLAGLLVASKSSRKLLAKYGTCLLYTSDAADDLTRLDLGGRRLMNKDKAITSHGTHLLA